MLLAAFGYAVATLLIRVRLGEVPPLAVSAASLGIAAILLTPGAAVSLPTAADRSALAAIVALGVLCTAAAFALYYLLIARAGATRAALTTYLAPVFSLATGAIALSESIAPTAILGLALILAGSGSRADGPCAEYRGGETDGMTDRIADPWGARTPTPAGRRGPSGSTSSSRTASRSATSSAGWPRRRSCTPTATGSTSPCATAGSPACAAGRTTGSIAAGSIPRTSTAGRPTTRPTG